MSGPSETSEDALWRAVRTAEPTSKEGLLQRFFAYWFDAFVYNQIWEDPLADLQALQLDETSRVLTISSGGCNALNYLLAGPASVTAVDLNRHHVYLLDLKLAALKHLPDHESFFAFFGAGKADGAAVLYRRYIAPNLDARTRRFWESNSLFGRLLHGRRISFFENGGLYNHSRNAYFLKFFHRYAKLIGLDPAKILKATSPAEQAEIYQQHIGPFFDNFVFKLIGRLPVTMFGLGIPPQQYEELTKELGGDSSIIDLYRERVRRLACDFPIGENYFAWQAFARRYDTEKQIAVPDYLKRENYDWLRQSADKLSTRISSITDAITRRPKGAFDRFVFLDAQDWMDLGSITDLWTAIAEKGAPDSRVIFRTAGSKSPVETSLPVELMARFEYDADLSAELFKKDRSSIYGGFHLYKLRG